MAEHGRRREGHLALDHVQVGVADAARRDAHEHLAAARAGDGDLLQLERLPGTRQHCRRIVSLIWRQLAPLPRPHSGLLRLVEHVRAMVY